jgi:ubiquitin C-terminal hydrolase
LVGLRGVDKVRCAQCDRESHTFVVQDHLSVAIPTPPLSGSVEECIREHVAPEDIDGRCTFPQFAAQGGRTKSKVVSAWPSVLVLHAKRWLRTSDGSYGKVLTPVDFETILSDLPGLPGCFYQLHAVVLHIGEAGHGHYVSCVRHSDGRWHYCDDIAPPRLIRVAEVLQPRRGEAVMLFYERNMG